MLALIIIFFLILLATVIFLMYKTGQIRSGKLPYEKKHEFGDKDTWLKQHIKIYAKSISRILSEILFSILIWCFKNWVRLNRKLYKSIKSKFPEIGYILGDKPKLKNPNESTPLSSYIADIKEHQQNIRNNGDADVVVQQIEIVEEIVVTPIEKPKQVRKRRLKVKSEDPGLDNESLKL